VKTQTEYRPLAWRKCSSLRRIQYVGDRTDSKAGVPDYLLQFLQAESIAEKVT
jgi:hypothetical protein